MEKKQKDRKELSQAAKRRELIQKECGSGEHRTVSKRGDQQRVSSLPKLQH